MRSEEPPRPLGRGARKRRRRRGALVGLLIAVAVALAAVPTSAWCALLGWRSGSGEAVPPRAAWAGRTDVEEPGAEPLRVAVGDRLPDLPLRDADAGEVRPGDYAGRLPLVIEFGSFT
jgi:hypothetical protein